MAGFVVVSPLSPASPRFTPVRIYTCDPTFQLFTSSDMLLKKLLLLTTLAALPCSALLARDFTLARALALTLERNPELTAFNWDIRSAEARTLQASLRPNPGVGLQSENIGGSGGGAQAERTLQLSQLLELGGKRPARVREARATALLAQWDYQVKRVEVLKTTAQLFVDVLALQRRVEVAAEVVQAAKDTVPLAEQRVTVGKASSVETARAQIAVAAADIALEQAKRDLLAARGQLAAQWGAKQADFSLVAGDLDATPATPSLSSLRAQLYRNPQLARWTTERERREAALASQRAQARPDLNLVAGPRVDGRGETTSAVFGFSLPLPLFNRNQGNIAAARADLSKVDEMQRAAEARAFAALNDAYQKAMAATREATILRRDVIPRAEEAMNLLGEGYTTGRFSQFEVFDGRRTLNEARTQEIRALADYHKALAEIEALTARPVELSRAIGGALKSSGKD